MRLLQGPLQKDWHQLEWVAEVDQGAALCLWAQLGQGLGLGQGRRPGCPRAGHLETWRQVQLEKLQVTLTGRLD